jgi:hypothetical protein
MKKNCFLTEEKAAIFGPVTFEVRVSDLEGYKWFDYTS